MNRIIRPQFGMGQPRFAAFHCTLTSPMPKDYAGQATHHDTTLIGHSRTEAGRMEWRRCVACGTVFHQACIARS